MTFPSDCQVIRAQEMSRFIVSVFGDGWCCIATGATPEEADEKASKWAWQNEAKVYRGGNLLAAMTRLGEACDDLWFVLKTR